MKTIQEMLQELSQCIVTVSGEFRFRTNWNGGKVPQPDLDIFDPNVPFCIENVGDVKVSVQYNTKNTNIRISKDYKTWNDYTSGTEIELNPTDRVYIKSDYVKDLGSNPRFVFNGDGARLRARGNIASLIYGTNDAYVNKYTSTEVFCYHYMFDGCTSLVQAPELPATKLNYNCYSRMFRGCSSLTQAPELPSIHVVTDCYNSMFSGCTSLTRAPELPVTTLAERCYNSMFSGCTSLNQAPELPATTLASYCYYDMFTGCTSLNQAPELPATTLANSCYSNMFTYCTSLNQAPELPATTLANWCYARMFMGCTSLTHAPELPATTLAKNCYDLMFANCTKLNYVKCLATDTSATDCTKNWLSNVAATGTFECDNKKYFTIDSPNGIPSGWTITEINPDPPTPPEPEKPDLDIFDPNVPFCIENIGEVPASVQYNTKNTNIRVSKDYKTWNDYTSGTEIELNPKDRVYIKSDHVKDTGNSPRFVFNGDGARLRARGNIASLIYGTNDAYVNKYTSTEEYCYAFMFEDCTSLVQAPELPAITLASYCYFHMFYGCTSLTQAPELPATTLTKDCYNSMFHGCASLTQAPELPATTLAYGCYCYMFVFCTKLNYVKCLATNISAENCTLYWLSNVASTGDFYAPASTNWTTGESGIPQGWTRHDIT